MNVEITGKYIKIGQLLKKMKIIASGGMAKTFLANTEVKVGGKRILNRSTKIKPGCTLWIGYKVYKIVQKIEDSTNQQSKKIQ